MIDIPLSSKTLGLVKWDYFFNQFVETKTLPDAEGF